MEEKKRIYYILNLKKQEKGKLVIIRLLYLYLYTGKRGRNLYNSHI